MAALILQLSLLPNNLAQIISFLLKNKIVEGEYQFSPYDLQAINQLKEEKYATTQWNFQATAPKWGNYDLYVKLSYGKVYCEKKIN